MSHANRASRIDRLRLVALGRIPRCPSCPRYRFLIAAADDRVGQPPQAPRSCTHEVCAPLMTRYVASDACDPEISQSTRLAAAR